MRWRIGLLGLALLASGILVWRLAGTSATSLDAALTVDCNADEAGTQRTCHYPSGATFRARVLVTRAPQVPYVGFQVKLGWNDSALSYVPKPGEVLPPVCEPPAQIPERPPGLFGCILSEPSTSSSLPLVQAQFTCKQDAVTDLTLVPRKGDLDAGTHLLDEALSPLDPVLADAVVDCGFTKATTTPTPTSLPKGPSFRVLLGTDDPHYVGDVVPVMLDMSYQGFPDADGDTKAGYYAMQISWTVPPTAQDPEIVWPDCRNPGPISSTSFVCYVPDGRNESMYTGPVLQVQVPCLEAGTVAFYTPGFLDGQLLSEQGWEFVRHAGGVGGQLTCLSPPAPTDATDVPPPTVPATPTPTATDPPDADSDGDGCTNAQEKDSDPLLGGGRDSHDFWDFFDTPNGANERDGVVSVGDIGRVVARFGMSGDPGVDPLSPPPPAGYHTAFDRSGPPPGADPWDAGPPDGIIPIEDIGLVVRQFGHSCA